MVLQLQSLYSMLVKAEQQRNVAKMHVTIVWFVCTYSCPSIHPSIHLICLLQLSNFLSGNGLWGKQQPQQGDFLLPSYFGQLFSKNPKPLSGQQKDIVSLKCPGSSRGPSTGHALNTSQGRRPGGIWTRCLSHLIRLLSTNSWEEQRLYSELLLNDRASHPS